MEYEPHHSDERPMRDNADPVSSHRYRAVVFVIFDPVRQEYLMSNPPRGWSWTPHREHAAEFSDERGAALILTTEKRGRVSAFVGKTVPHYTVGANGQ